MRRLKSVPAAVVALICLVSLGASPASAAGVDEQLKDRLIEQDLQVPSATDGTYTWPEFAQPVPGKGSTTQAICQFNNLLDSIHYSSTPPATLSVHGYWENVNCDATRAVVTTQLQKKNSIGLWVDVGTRGVKTVYSGGGSANRSNSRYECSGTGTHTFRAWVDVDVVGIADLPDKFYHPAVEFACN